MTNLLEKIKKYIELWPVATFLVFLLGYIGFYTYSTQNQISFVNPDISIIIGIGLYNLFVLALLINPGKRNRKPNILRTYLTANYINFLTINPLLMGGLIILDFQLYVVRNQIKGFESQKKKKKIEYSKKRKLASNRFIYQMISDGIFLTIIILIGLFLDYNFMFMAMVIHFIGVAFFYLKKELKKNILVIILVSLFIPILTSTYFLKDINYTVLGLSKEYSEIYTNNGDRIRGIVTYKSQDEISITTDSTKLLIPYDEILKVQKIDTVMISDRGIERIKNVFKKQ